MFAAASGAGPLVLHHHYFGDGGAAFAVQALGAAAGLGRVHVDELDELVVLLGVVAMLLVLVGVLVAVAAAVYADVEAVAGVGVGF